MTDHSSLLDRLTEKAGRLYSLPAVAVEVLKLTNSPKVDSWALKKCIENDPALATKVLRVVNSSLFGLSRQVSDLNQALALLGIKPLKLLVLGFSLPDTLYSGVAGDVLSQYWWHTLTKAVAARELSETVWHQPGDEAFIAGLLQDIGMLVLIQEVGDPYVRFLEHVFAEKRDLLSLEARSLSFNHLALSERLLEAWGLPEPLVKAIAVGNSPEKVRDVPVGERTLPHILHLADLLAVLLTEQRADVLPALLEAGKRYRNLSQEDLGRLVQGLQEKVEQLASVLVLELPKGTNYCDVLTQAHTQLSIAAAEAAEDLLAAKRNNEANADEQLLAETRFLAEAAAALARPAPARAPAKTVAAVTAAPKESTPRREQTASHSPLPIRAPHQERDRFYAPEPADSAAGSTDADHGFLGRLTTAVAACRQSRCSLSLLLIEIDRFAHLVTNLGVPCAEELVRQVHATCRQIDHKHTACLQIREACFAVILSDCERLAAVEIGNELLRDVRQLAMRLTGKPDALTVSVGAATVALPPKNFPTRDLFDCAERCLHGAHAGGGNGLKSIGVY